MNNECSLKIESSAQSAVQLGDRAIQDEPKVEEGGPVVASLVSTFADRPVNNSIFMGVFTALIAMFAGWFIFGDSYDNDIWFILATGKEIVQNGIPYENPFSVFEGLQTVIQQWVVCVLYYEIHSHFGFVGLGIWVTVLYACVILSLYRVARICRGDSFGGEWLLLFSLIASIPMSSYMTVRPHMYTMLAFTWIVGFLELYRRSGNVKYLIALPIICAIHINFQAAMAPFDLVIIACYAIPNFMKPLHKADMLRSIDCANWNYGRLPLLIALVVCVFAMLCNPYGIEGALYLVNSYGSAAYRDYISEMGHLAPAGSVNFAVFVVALCAFCIAAGRIGLKRIDFPLILLIAGTTYLGFVQVRNYWLAPLFIVFYLSWASKGFSIRLFSDAVQAKLVGACIALVGIVIGIVFIFYKAPSFADIPKNDDHTPVAAMDYLDEIGADKETTKVLDFFNPGGYIEYRGYKVNVDPRPELWNSGITKKDFDYYNEYIDMHAGDIFFDDYIDKYGFNVFVVPEDDGAIDLLKDAERFLEISGGSGYRAFIAKDAYEEITGKDIKTAPQVQRKPVKSS